jgi:acetyltransferase
MDANDSAPKRTDPSHDVLRSGALPLDAVFHPRSVAVLGASAREGSVGRTLLSNLIAGFRGDIYPVNPNHSELLGLRTFPSVRAVSKEIDLAVIATPAATVPGVIAECVDCGVRAAVVISAGFREHGAAGAELERQVSAHLRRGRLRLIGPNCLGVMNPLIGLNATFAQTIARPGNVAFLSQSGALLTAILDWSLREQIGFSAFVSTGSMLDVGWGDLITYFGNDPQTKSILIYMESVGDARSFLSAAREVSLSKPIIILKAGRTEAASHAAASHTGALTGSDEVLEAAFRRCGVLRVTSIADLFHMAEVLSKQPRPLGPRLTILTNAGGPAVLATDALIAAGGELAPLSPESMKALNELLPSHWSHGNPIDILGDGGPDRFARAAEIAVSNPASDGLLVILAPQGMTDPAAAAERLKPFAHQPAKPVLASWMGGQSISAGEAILNAGGIPTFSYPDAAARAFVSMWRYTYNLRGIYETPTFADDPHRGADARLRIENFLEHIRGSGRTILTEFESKKVLAAYDIPTTNARIARSEDEVSREAAEIGFPVVVKLHSETITHKTDIGGVKLNLADAAAARAAYRAIESSVSEKVGAQHFQGVTVQPMVRRDGYELILGSSIDAQFGPVLLFGSGGQLVEVYRDRSLALPPLNSTLAQRMMEQTLIWKALQGVRGRAPVNLDALKNLLVRFSQLVVEQRWIKEVDMNPLLASPEGLLALDARIVLQPPDVSKAQLPRLAIRPYPSQYVSSWKMKGDIEVIIRPIRPEDEPLMVKFHEALSERSVYLRYFHLETLPSRIAHERLARICFIDYDREMTLIGERRTESGESEILGAGRLTKLPSRNEAEVAVLVRDQYQHRGLGRELLRRLLVISGEEKLERIIAYMLRENVEMQALAAQLGFRFEPSEDPALVTAVYRP